MKLIWTYSDRFKKGKPNKNTAASHEYIQFLFRKSIKESPCCYEKIVFTDDYNFSLFSDLDVELIQAPKKDFIFLDDLKFDAAEAIDGEFIITDGDLFIKEELTIPKDYKVGFELKVDCKPCLDSKMLMQKEGIGDILPYWKGNNSFINNLGLMYFNDDTLKKDIVNEYRNTQSFFTEYIDKKYKINERDVLFGGTGCCMFLYQYLTSRNIPTFYFIDDNFGKFNHLGALRKLEFLDEFHKLNGGPRYSERVSLI